MSRILSCLLVLLSLAASARAEAPARSLPPPLAQGGLCGFLSPCARSGDLAGHLRLTLQFLDLPDRFHFGGQAALSFSLFHWAEAGASFYGTAQNGEGEGAGIDFRQGPITLWGRLSPPPLSAIFSDYPDEGLFFAAQAELAVGRAPFDAGGTLVPDAQTYALIAEYRRWRVRASASAAAQLADGQRYRGLQAAGGLWLQVLSSMAIGAEVLGRAGAWAEDPAGSLQTTWTAFVGVAVLDAWGFQGGGGYLRSDGRSDAGVSSAVAKVGVSYGRSIQRPPPDPMYPVLIPDLDLWAPPQAAWRARGAPGFGAANDWTPPIWGPVATACAVPPRTIVSLSGCLGALRAETAAQLAQLDTPPLGPVLALTRPPAPLPGVAQVRPPVRPPPRAPGAGGRRPPVAEAEPWLPGFRPPPGAVLAPPGPRPPPGAGPSIGPVGETPVRPPAAEAVRIEPPPHVRVEDLPPALRPPPRLPTQALAPTGPTAPRPAPRPPAPPDPGPAPPAQVAEHAPAAPPAPRPPSARSQAIDARLPPAPRRGTNFTPAGRREVWQAAPRNAAGQPTCEECGIPVRPPAGPRRAGQRVPPDEGQVDHIIPKARGGQGTPDNGQILCRDCNLSKSDGPAVPWLRNPVAPSPRRR